MENFKQWLYRVKIAFVSSKFYKFAKKIIRRMNGFSNFNNGEYVAWKHNGRLKGIVMSNLLVEGKIEIAYFSEVENKMTTTTIDPELLEYSIEEYTRRRVEGEKNRNSPRPKINF